MAYNDRMRGVNTRLKYYVIQNYNSEKRKMLKQKYTKEAFILY